MPSYGHLLTQQCTVQRYLDDDEYGDPVYGDKVTIRCAVAAGYAKVRDSDGSERVSGQQMVTEVAIDVADRVWLPGKNVNDENAAIAPLSTVSDQSRRTGLVLYQSFF